MNKTIVYVPKYGSREPSAHFLATGNTIEDDFFVTTRDQYISLDDDFIIDTYNEFGVIVKEGDYKSLLNAPQYSKVNSTEWHEYDGVEVNVIEKPTYKPRTITIPFIFKNRKRLAEFIDFLAGTTDTSSTNTGRLATRTWYFEEIDEYVHLRLQSNGALNINVELGTFSLTFVQDDPHTFFEKNPPIPTYRNITSQGVFLNDIDLATMGIQVLQGTDESLLKVPTIRENVKVIDTYDEALMRFKSKDVTLKLFIHTHEGISDFWTRYNTLLYELTKNTLATIDFPTNECDPVECYYKSTNVTRFEILHNGCIWCELDLVLTLTDYKPQGHDEYKLLTTEKGVYIKTSDGSYVDTKSIYEPLHDNIPSSTLTPTKVSDFATDSSEEYQGVFLLGTLATEQSVKVDMQTLDEDYNTALDLHHQLQDLLEQIRVVYRNIQIKAGQQL